MMLSGTGALTKSGAGTLTLTGANTYTGGTTINTGTLQIGNGDTSGSIAGNVADNTAITFNRSDTVTYGGVISGAGTLTKSGAGTLHIDGREHLRGRHDDQRRSAADRRRGDHGQHRRQHDRQLLLSRSNCL